MTFDAGAFFDGIDFDGLALDATAEDLAEAPVDEEAAPAEREFRRLMGSFFVALLAEGGAAVTPALLEPGALCGTAFVFDVVDDVGAGVDKPDVDCVDVFVEEDSFTGVATGVPSFFGVSLSRL